MALFENKTEETAIKKTSDRKRPTAISAELRAVLIQPRLSEKAAKANESGKYIFEVAPSANKISIKKAVERIYTVNVTQVNIIRTEGKKRRYGATSGKMSDFKKAIVTLKKGQTIQTAEAKV